MLHKLQKILLLNEDILTVNRGPSRGQGRDYATIEEALSAAQEGDIIELADGKYEEVITITVPGITIRASKSGKAKSVVTKERTV
eukprot:scaffold8903_cov89-Skeletonema_marinoi.AAC.4